MPTLTLSVCTGDYDRTRPLRSGAVEIAGCTLDYTVSDPGSTFQRLFREHAFDLSEMSFSTYMMALGRGDFPYRALPIFLSRVFPHGSIYVRTDRGIATADDLRGRLIGVPSAHFTRGLVVKGMLQDEYGVAPSDLRWRVGGIDRAEDDFSYVARPTPPGLDLHYAQAGAVLSDELVAGAIDGIVTYRDPQAFRDRAPHVGRLFPDFRPLEQDWYRRTRIFPVMHVMGLRTSLIERHPWLPRAVCAAFQDAKEQSRPMLFDLDALHTSLPWLVAEAEATVRLMGEDFWPYGVAANGPTLQAQTRWSFEQGLSPRRYEPEELFDATTLDWAP